MLAYDACDTSAAEGVLHRRGGSTSGSGCRRLIVGRRVMLGHRGKIVIAVLTRDARMRPRAGGSIESR